MDNFNIIYIYSPEIFFLVSLFGLFVFYLFSFYQATRSASFFASRVSFFHVFTRFASYILFFASILFAFQFSAVQFIGQPILLFNNTLYIDLMSVFFKFCVTLISGLILNSTLIYSVRIKSFSIEHVLVFLIFVFSLVIGFSAYDFLVFYVSLELQSLCVYVLLINPKKFKSVKAGIKYFFYSITSSAFFLAGVGFVYFNFGSLNYSDLSLLISTSSLDFKKSPAFILAQIFVFSSMFFKLGVFPFQAWVPATYSYNSFPAVFTLATVSKMFAFFASIRFLIIFSSPESPLLLILYYVGIASVIWGVIGAFFQTEIFKVIGYSAIAQVGHTVLILSFFNYEAFAISIFYFFVYMFISFSFFFAISNIFRVTGFTKFEPINFKAFKYIHDFQGLFQSNQTAAFFFAVTLFSYAGIPPFAGFYSKYLLFYYLIQHGFFFTFFFLFFFSVLSAFYYLSIIVNIYFKDTEPVSITISHSSLGMLILLTVFNIFSIFFFDYLIKFIFILLNFLFLCHINLYLLEAALLLLEFM